MEEETLAILWNRLEVWGFFQFTGGSNHPLGKTCYNKGLARRGLRPVGAGVTVLYEKIKNKTSKLARLPLQGGGSKSQGAPISYYLA